MYFSKKRNSKEISTDNISDELSKNTIEKTTSNKQKKIIKLTDDEIASFVNQEILDRTIGTTSYDYNKKLDKKLKEAALIIFNSKKISALMLQREMRLGYNRVGRIIDQLEIIGMVSAFNQETKSRTILINHEEKIDILIEKYISASKSPERKFFETNILPNKNDYIEKKVNEYFENLYNEELKERIRQEILEKEKTKAEQEKAKKLRKEVIQELSQMGVITTEDYTSKKREPIPQDVQNKVWNRDGGKCVKCGNNENLEFDHIIPFSKGGSNTYRNLQLLCQECNRKKSNNIG